jgi:hypothetical protein
MKKTPHFHRFPHLNEVLTQKSEGKLTETKIQKEDGTEPKSILKTTIKSDKIENKKSKVKFKETQDDSESESEDDSIYDDFQPLIYFSHPWCLPMQISLLGVHMILLPWLQYCPQNLSIYHKYPLLKLGDLSICGLLFQ